MSRHILLMRHGEAGLMAEEDSERVLTERGEAQVLATLEHLSDLKIDHIIASPYRRAQQTAGLICQTFTGSFTTSDLLVPDADPVVALKELVDQSSEQSIMLVCHMPLVSNMAGWLLDNAPSRGLRFATADVAVIEAEWVAGGFGVLEAVFGPQGRL
ncbi:phosphohistidine phosphatase SixA [Aestuariirhabdus sp. Z084]|uniref:phosphohistidine phosphatase SixA n=1 Tax=Aestuariirhabdus haliotis TaxID=2918751 RepID=UPI00201B428C|nr:phosphohistidine phosphatase SixA [Aestuariirhabdus haliotis]MCL6414522.1 phosphohistidine phosphatase SixA [Aestuariirhabdus haliotis]MCL6418496.1 phosphohistidine phosphatase SixA [Aestuariirhabdus haliotis]